MQRRPAQPKPVYQTVAQVQGGPHYATHVDQPIVRRPMRCILAAHMDEKLHACDPATARGVPECFNYANGVLRVWPWPAEGWQVWSEVSGKAVLP